MQKQWGFDGGGGGNAEIYDEIIEAIENEDAILIFDDSARNGQMEEFGNYLRKQKIPYIQQSEAKYEYNGETVFFDGTAASVFQSNQSGEIVVPQSVVISAMECISRGDNSSAVELLKQYTIIPEVPLATLIADEILFTSPESNGNESSGMGPSI